MSHDALQITLFKSSTEFPIDFLSIRSLGIEIKALLRYSPRQCLILIRIQAAKVYDCPLAIRVNTTQPADLMSEASVVE